MNEIIEDSQFGKLTWDTDLELWMGKVNGLSGENVELLINTPDENDRTITTQLRDGYTLVLNSDNKFRQKACDDLLTTLNECWNQSDDIDESVFKQRMTPESINLYPDGSAAVFYADGNMFGGHVIIVEMEYTGQLDEAYLGG